MPPSLHRAARFSEIFGSYSPVFSRIRAREKTVTTATCARNTGIIWLKSCSLQGQIAGAERPILRLSNPLTRRHFQSSRGLLEKRSIAPKIARMIELGVNIDH